MPTSPPPAWPIHDEGEVDAVARVARTGKWQYGIGSEGTELEEQFAEWIGKHDLELYAGYEKSGVEIYRKEENSDG